MVPLTPRSKSSLPLLLATILQIILTTFAKSTTNETNIDHLIRSGSSILQSRFPSLSFWTISIEPFPESEPLTIQQTLSDPPVPKITFAAAFPSFRDIPPRAPTLITLANSPSAPFTFDPTDIELSPEASPGFVTTWFLFTVDDILPWTEVVETLEAHSGERGPWNGVNLVRHKEGQLSDQLYWLLSRIEGMGMRTWAVGCQNKSVLESDLDGMDGLREVRNGTVGSTFRDWRQNTTSIEVF